MKVFFIDTNIFLQCRDLQQLPWSDIGEKEEHIQLFVPRAVQREIDRQKGDGNGRRSKRARKANSLLRNILLPGSTFSISRQGPSVEMALATSLEREYLPANALDTLDLSQMDDSIIAEVLSFRQKNSGVDVAILSGGIGILATAHSHGIPCFEVPDTWLLEPEPDVRDKKIAELQEELRMLQSRYPVIEMHAEDACRNQRECFSVQVTRYRELTEDEIDGLVAEVKKRYPMKEFPVQNPPESRISQEYPSTIAGQLALLGAGTRALIEAATREIPPSKEAIDKYQNHEYPAWIEKVKGYARALPKELEGPSRKSSLVLIVSNDGSVPAQNTLVDLSIHGDAVFIGSKLDNVDHNLAFPSPPAPPMPTSQYSALARGTRLFDDPHFRGFGAFDNLRTLDSLLQRPDRNDFHFKGGEPRKPEKQRVLECEEFRHQTYARFQETLFIFPAGQDSLTISCTVSASNLPRPVDTHIKLDITYVDGDTLAEIRKRVFTSRDG